MITPGLSPKDTDDVVDSIISSTTQLITEDSCPTDILDAILKELCDCREVG